MKASFFAIAAVSLLPTALGQTIEPSPTESVGCEPHGDHWHCDGPRETVTDLVLTTTETLAPSPTGSIGCEPHGDHWHCDGPRTTTAADDDHDHDDHDHDHDHDHAHETTETLMPSPTESIGCEPHGDHWHCDGPATTGAVANSTGPTTTTTPTGSPTTNVPTDAAALNVVPLVGMLAVAMLVV